MNVLTTLVGEEGLGIWVAAILTLMVYSYLLGDNPLFRLAEYLLVGLSVAYAAVVAYHDVLVPFLIAPLLADGMGRLDLFIPLVLGLLLFAKALPALTALGSPALGYLVGIGLGLAVGGALVGTLAPQVAATFLPVVPDSDLSLVDAVSNLLIVIGTITSLLVFRFVIGFGRGPAPAAVAVPAARGPVYVLGRGFIMIAFGALFGGAVLTYLSLLIGRWDFLINGWLRPVLGF